MKKQSTQGKVTYDLLINSALELASEGGLQNISAGKLSLKAGVGKSTVFHHFKTTKDILIAMFQFLIDKQLGILENSNYDSVQDFSDILSSLLFSDDEILQKINRVFLSYYHESIFDNELKFLLNEYLEKTIKILTKKLMNCKDNNANYERTQIVSRLIIVKLDGFGLHIMTMNDVNTYKELWKMEMGVIILMLK